MRNGNGKKRVIDQKSVFILPFSFQGIEFDENGNKLFEGEFKDGEYWNGKGKKNYSKFPKFMRLSYLFRYIIQRKWVNMLRRTV